MTSRIITTEGRGQGHFLFVDMCVLSIESYQIKSFHLCHIYDDANANEMI